MKKFFSLFIITAIFSYASLTAQEKIHKDRVVAIVNLDAITVYEVEKFRENIRKQRPLISEEELADYTQRFLKNKIDELLILQEAKNEGFIATSDEIDYYLKERLDEIKKQFPDEGAFQRALTKEGLSETKLKEKLSREITKDILKRKVINKNLVSKISIKEEDIIDYDKKLKSQVVLRNIFLTRRSEAEEVLQKLKEGEDFEKLVKEYSLAADRKEGGIIQNISVEELNTLLRRAVMDMTPGEISGILEAENGYYIIRLESLSPPVEFTPLDETRKAKVRDILFQDRLDKLLSEWIRQLYNHAYIEIRDYLLE